MNIDFFRQDRFGRGAQRHLIYGNIGITVRIEINSINTGRYAFCQNCIFIDIDLSI